MELLPAQDGVVPFFKEEEGKLIQGTLQDCTPIADDAKEMNRVLGKSNKGDLRLAATLPMVAVETYCNINGITFAEFMGDRVHIRRMCNDPALRDFRVWEGRL